MGLGYYPAPGATVFNPDGTNMDMIIENNLFDGWNGEEELITIKSSHNIIRNNCVKNAPNTYFVNRLGDNNLITGNWQQGVRNGGMRISGAGTTYAFNYYSTSGHGAHAFRLHQGGYSGSLYTYLSADNAVLEYNVFNRLDHAMETRARLGGTFDDAPSGVVFQNNDFYSSAFVGGASASSSSYQNTDGTWTYSQFIANNTWGTNTVINSNLTDTDCGDPSLFDGPGTQGITHIPGNPNLLDPNDIYPPSWWD